MGADIQYLLHREFNVELGMRIDGMLIRVQMGL
jgi:hypothetical protein